MNKSEIFKAAHKLAKTFIGSYVACFALALKTVYKNLKEKVMRTMKQTVAAIIEAAKAKGHEVIEYFNGQDTYIDIEIDALGDYAEVVVYKNGTHDVAFGRGKITDIIKSL